MSQTADESSVRRKPAGIPGGVLVALILVAFLYGGLRVARRPHLVGKGALAPSFTLERYGGGRISLDELRGKVVLLNFWATWCPPCVEEMPSLLKVARSEEHTSELQSHLNLVCRLLLEKKKILSRLIRRLTMERHRV